LKQASDILVRHSPGRSTHAATVVGAGVVTWLQEAQQRVHFRLFHRALALGRKSSAMVFGMHKYGPGSMPRAIVAVLTRLKLGVAKGTWVEAFSATPAYLRSEILFNTCICPESPFAITWPRAECLLWTSSSLPSQIHVRGGSRSSRRQFVTIRRVHS